MPKIGSGESGTVISWQVEVGDAVEAGDLIAEVETEKANVEVEAPAPGRVARFLVAVDREVPVGTVIAELEEDTYGES